MVRVAARRLQPDDCVHKDPAKLPRVLGGPGQFAVACNLGVLVGTIALVLPERDQQVFVVGCHLSRLTHRGALAVLESSRALVKDGSTKTG